MKTMAMGEAGRVAEAEWIPFPGGELEGRRPRVLCPECREQLRQTVDARRPTKADGTAAAPFAIGASGRPSRPALCFACYRAGLARDAAIKVAGELNTATDARFQSILPLERVDHSRLVRLRAERGTERLAGQVGAGRFIDKRRQAQIAARHALQKISEGFGVEQTGGVNAAALRTAHDRERWSAVHAAELQLPEAWLPFVMSR